MSEQMKTQDPAPTGGLTGRGRFLAALSCARLDRPPVWFMRQAGRHLPGYRSIRKRLGFLDICADTEACVEVSAEPWRRYGVDGAIIFNDILTPLRDMGMGIDFVPGPRFDRLIATPADAAALDHPSYGPDTDVSRGLSALRETVGEDAAVLGFVGAPFTVASYAVAGMGAARAMPVGEAIVERRDALESLRDRLVGVLRAYALAQIEAGADVIQVFESSATELSEPDYRRIALPAVLDLVRQIKAASPATPVIAFGRGTWAYIPDLAGAGADALSLDWERPLAEARAILRDAGHPIALQGNLASDALLGDADGATRAANELLSQWRSIVPHPGRAGDLGPTGWVFNLGHGVPKDADPATVEAAVRAVRAYDFDPDGVLHAEGTA
jgi:uroporphyrinogen decarboxylase